MSKNGILFAAAASLVLASGASASRVDDGWLAWLGCWRAVGVTDGSMLCVVPEGQGVKLLGINADGTIKNETRIIADNMARQASQEGCSGTERAFWSKDQRRVFLRADQVCGEQTKRAVTGMLAMLKADQMVSVQSVTAYETTTARSVRYQYVEPAKVPAEVTAALAANRLARETARTAAGGRIDLDDVKEAVAAVHPEVVQGWLSAAEQKFELNGKVLKQLAAAGVPAGVIDVMVAVSNPRYFALKQPDEVEAEGRARGNDERDRDRTRYGRCYDSYMDPWFDPFGYSFYGQDRCRIGYYGYGMYGSPYGYYSPYSAWRYGTPVIVVRGGEEDSDGKVTRRGYSRGSSSSGSSSGGSYRPSTGSSSSGSGSTSSSGTSSSGSSTTRTAKPRGGN